MDLDLTTPEGRKLQGKLILDAVREAELSVEQLANEIGCSRALVYQYIAGTTLAQPDKLTLIAQRTGKPLVYFYGGEVQEPRESHDERDALQKERTEWTRLRAEERERRLKERMESLVALANALASSPDPKGAVSTYEQILPIASELGDVGIEATTLFQLGSLRLVMGDLEGAHSALRQAQALFERRRDRSSVLACRQNIGRILLMMGRPRDAEIQFHKVVDVEDSGNKWEGLVALAAVSEWTGDFQGAMAKLDEAESFSSRATTESTAQTIRLFVSANRANVYLSCGDFAMGSRMARQAQDLAEQMDNRDQQLEALLTAGVCQIYLGEWVLADETLHRAQNLADFAADAERSTVAQSSLALIMSITGNQPAAKNLGMRGLTAALRLRSRRAELWAHKSLAEIHLREESADDALYYASTAVEIAEAMQNVTEHAHALCLRSWTECLMEEPDTARITAQQAFDIADAKGIRHIAALASWLLAKLADSADIRRNNLEVAERLSRQTGDADLLWRCLATRTEGAVQRGKPHEAIPPLIEAHHMLMDWRKVWTGAEREDTWLEDPLRFRWCLTFADCISQRDGVSAGDELVDQLSWLPLHEAWEKHKSDVSKRPPRQERRARRKAHSREKK